MLDIGVIFKTFPLSLHPRPNTVCHAAPVLTVCVLLFDYADKSLKCSLSETET